MTYAFRRAILEAIEEEDIDVVHQEGFRVGVAFYASLRTVRACRCVLLRTGPAFRYRYQG
jgi:hypothetical protein